MPPRLSERCRGRPARIGESSKAFRSCSVYLHLPPEKRSFHAAAAQVDKCHQNLLRFAKKFDWEARCEAYDRHVEAEEAALFEEQRQAATKQRLRHELAWQAETWALAEAVAVKTRELLTLPASNTWIMHTPAACS